MWAGRREGSGVGKSELQQEENHEQEQEQVAVVRAQGSTRMVRIICACMQIEKELWLEGSRGGGHCTREAVAATRNELIERQLDAF